MKTKNETPLRILRAAALYEKTGLTKSTVQRLESAGEFPRRIKLGSHAAGWVESEIDAWIAARIAVSREESKAA